MLKTTLLVALGLGEDQAGKRFQSPKLSFFFDFFKRVSWNIIYMPENLPLFSLVIFSIFTELYHHRENFILLPQKETPYPLVTPPGYFI